jgi:hypothetical protein
VGKAENQECSSSPQVRTERSRIDDLSSLGKIFELSTQLPKNYQILIPFDEKISDLSKKASFSQFDTQGLANIIAKEAIPMLIKEQAERRLSLLTSIEDPEPLIDHSLELKDLMLKIYDMVRESPGF